MVRRPCGEAARRQGLCGRPADEIIGGSCRPTDLPARRAVRPIPGAPGVRSSVDSSKSANHAAGQRASGVEAPRSGRFEGYSLVGRRGRWNGNRAVRPLRAARASDAVRGKTEFTIFQTFGIPDQLLPRVEDQAGSCRRCRARCPEPEDPTPGWGRAARSAARRQCGLAPFLARGGRTLRAADFEQRLRRFHEGQTPPPRPVGRFGWCL